MNKQQPDLFGNRADDLPLFSGTAMRAPETRSPDYTPDPQPSLFTPDCGLCKDTGSVTLRKGQDPRPCTCAAGRQSSSLDLQSIEIEDDFEIPEIRPALDAVMPTDNPLTFNEFMRQVDIEIESICGLGHMDIGDYRYMDCYESEMTPYETAVEALEYSDFPMDLI